jgi:protein-S-isoprenylcysteine O-methyltransferase Ste14
MEILNLIFIPAEEQYCLKRYGNDYKEYMKRTPRWLGLSKAEKSD